MTEQKVDLGALRANIASQLVEKHGVSPEDAEKLLNEAEGELKAYADHVADMFAARLRDTPPTPPNERPIRG